jgi:hypothetical protein
MKTQLTTEEKAERARQRMLETAKQYQTGTYIRKFVAPVFQLCIRAEAAADPRPYVTAIVDGEIRQVKREIGQCVCVTCGKVGAWKGNSIGGGTIETGHFLASRRASIVFEFENANPQCTLCNRHLSGNQQLYRKWMIFVRGEEVVERLERLKTQSVSFTREELVDMRIGYAARLAAAELLIRSA